MKGLCFARFYIAFYIALNVKPSTKSKISFLKTTRTAIFKGREGIVQYLRDYSERSKKGRGEIVLR